VDKSIWVSALPSLGLEPRPHVTEVLKRSLRWRYRACHLTGSVFDEILFRKNFAKLATKRFSCFAKMRDDFREFCSFVKLPRLRKKRVLRNTKIEETEKT
jgi:hypothetical protein